MFFLYLTNTLNIKHRKNIIDLQFIYTKTTFHWLKPPWTDLIISKVARFNSRSYEGSRIFFKKPLEISKLATVGNTNKLKTHCFPKECYKRKIHFFAVVLAWYWWVAFQFNVKFQRKSTYPCTMKLNVDYPISILDEQTNHTKETL